MFRTRDGGKTWKKVLYVNDGAGAIDLVINRKTPDTLYAAMYEKHRTPWQIVEADPRAASTEPTTAATSGGSSSGLPTGKIGRIGLDIYQKQSEHPDADRREPESAERGDAGADRRVPGERRARRWCGRRRASRSRRRTDRQRGVPHRRRRQDVEEAARRRHRRRRRQGAVLVQPDPDQPADAPDRRDQRLDVRSARRRQDLDTATSSAACSATSARCGGTSRTRSASCSAATAA